MFYDNVSWEYALKNNNACENLKILMFLLRIDVSIWLHYQYKHIISNYIFIAIEGWAISYLLELKMDIMVNKRSRF